MGNEPKILKHGTSLIDAVMEDNVSDSTAMTWYLECSLMVLLFHDNLRHIDDVEMFRYYVLTTGENRIKEYALGRRRNDS